MFSKKTQLVKIAGAPTINNLSWAVKRNSSEIFELVCEDIPKSELAQGDVSIRIEYSSLNYKDVLSIAGKNGETKIYPQVIGIDAVGIVEHSMNSTIKVGTRVAQFGRGLGTTLMGGLSHYLNAKPEVLIEIPNSISALKAGAFGTAGLTASACVSRILEEGIKTSAGPILVTGAGGGVGRIALLMLSQLGYQTIASTRGAIFPGIENSQLIAPLKHSNFNLLPEKWTAVVETLGGESLATALKSTRAGGLVLSVGMVESASLSVTVYTFVLRGIKLSGINLDQIENKKKKELLNLVDSLISFDTLMRITKIIEFDDVPIFLELMKVGKHTGRTVVKIQAST